MGPGQNIRKLQVLVIIIIGCNFLAGAVSADCFDQFLSGAAGCSFDPGCNSKPYVCPFGGTCGGVDTVISLGMTGSRFFGTPSSGPAPLEVHFSANPGPESATWSWDFGDGSFGSGVSPVHTYAAPGDYSVKLTVRQEGGQADVNYRTSTSSSWGQESTWLKQEMIHVTGPVSVGNLVSADQNGTAATTTGLAKTGPAVQPVTVIQYIPGMNPPVSIPKTQPLFVSGGTTTGGASAKNTWKTGTLGYC